MTTASHTHYGGCSWLLRGRLLAFAHCKEKRGFLNYEQAVGPLNGSSSGGSLTHFSSLVGAGTAATVRAVRVAVGTLGLIPVTSATVFVPARSQCHHTDMIDGAVAAVFARDPLATLDCHVLPTFATRIVTLAPLYSLDVLHD